MRYKNMLPNGICSTNRFKKRERTQNWAFEEKKFLLELCRKDMHIIENKRLDADLTAMKNRAWKQIHVEFSKVFGNERNCNRLKEQWRRMKACTRSEIVDYTHRIAKYGQDIADKKRPNPFTFEIWDFMQTAKRTSKADISQVIEYEQAQLTLEAKKSAMELDEEDKPNEEPTIVSDDDDEDLFKWHKSTQSLCEVEIKDETSSSEEMRPITKPSVSINKRNWSRSNSNNNNNNNNTHNNQNNNNANKTNNSNSNNHNSSTDEHFQNNYEANIQIPPMQLNDFISTMDTVNILKDRNAEEQSDELKIFMDMHKKEHQIRLDLLKVQLETAKLNRDIAEINKMILLRDIQEKK